MRETETEKERERKKKRERRSGRYRGIERKEIIKWNKVNENRKRDSINDSIDKKKYRWGWSKCEISKMKEKTLLCI